MTSSARSAGEIVCVWVLGTAVHLEHAFARGADALDNRDFARYLLFDAFFVGFAFEALQQDVVQVSIALDFVQVLAVYSYRPALKEDQTTIAFADPLDGQILEHLAHLFLRFFKRVLIGGIGFEPSIVSRSPDTGEIAGLMHRAG